MEVLCRQEYQTKALEMMDGCASGGRGCVIKNTTEIEHLALAVNIKPCCGSVFIVKTTNICCSWT